MTIQSTLNKLGFNDKEIKVYLALLKNGKTKPSVLAKMTKLNRATLYNIANSLVSKGIIVEDVTSKTLHFAPLPPSSLINILEQTKREVNEKELIIKKAIDELSIITADKIYPVPKIRFVQENDLEKYLYDNLSIWQQSIIESDGVWWGFQDHTFVEHYEKWINSTWETKESQNENYLGAWIFSNKSTIEQKLQKKFAKRDIRFLENFNFTATVWVCGEYLITVQTNQHPFYLSEIHDVLLAQNMRGIFRKLWETSTEQSKKII